MVAAADERAGAGVAVADRAAAAEGLKNTEIAERLGVRHATVGKWRKRFAEHRLDGLLDEPRPGQPRKITDEQVEEVIVKTLESDAEGRDALVDALDGRGGRAQRRPRCSRIWRAFGLQPHRQDTWKLSKDPLFVEKVRDVVGLYLDPPERAVVLCVDEKSQIQALDRTAPILPMLPGTPERATHDYKRAGHLEPLRRAGPRDRQGDRLAAPAATARSSSRSSCSTIDREVPAELEVHLVLDNSATHKTPAIQRWLAAHPRFVLALHPDLAAPG